MTKADRARKDAYAGFVLEQLAPLGEITCRSMFGGYAIYCDGTVFALIANNVLYLKVDDGNRPMFEVRGLGPFRPFEDKGGMMSYYEAPAEVFEDAAAMRHWAGAALEAGRRAQAKKKPSAKKVKRRL